MLGENQVGPDDRGDLQRPDRGKPSPTGKYRREVDRWRCEMSQQRVVLQASGLAWVA